MRTTLPWEIEFQRSDVPPCESCDSPSLLLARYPHIWQNQGSEDVRGVKEALLCPNCDASQPEAALVLALFTVDGQLDDANLGVFRQLAEAWVVSMRNRTVDIVALAEEEEQWRRGELG